MLFFVHFHEKREPNCDRRRPRRQIEHETLPVDVPRLDLVSNLFNF